MQGIANAFVSQVVEAGETIYHAGSPQDRLIILAQGQVDHPLHPKVLLFFIYLHTIWRLMIFQR